MKKTGTLTAIILFLLPWTGFSQYQHRNLHTVSETIIGLSSPSAHYMALFGKGTDSSSMIKGIIRYGELLIDPQGSTARERSGKSEIVMYVTGGTGILHCDKKENVIASDDFFYIPSGHRFSLSNSGGQQLSVILMEFGLIRGDTVKPAKRPMFASAGEVPFQVLGYHGPTTTFQLLLGTTLSTRDRLAAASRVSSLFVMDFAPGGTNIPHRHNDEEEIYLLIRGKGDIVAGQKSDSTELRHPSAHGDAWFFSPGCLIGFYSGNGENEEHARILAVRFRYPSGTRGQE